MSTVQPDSELQRLLDGDEAVLGELLAAYQPRLWRMVQFRLDRRLLGRVDPDDILQEAYLDAAQRLRHLRSSPPPTAFLWLRSMVLQTMINVHRRHLGAKIRDVGREVSIHSGPAHPTSVALAAKLLDSLTSPSGQAMRHELSGQLEQALESLSAVDREVLVLRHFEELTNSEVAQVLGLQQKAASIRYIRALGRLQAVVAELPGLQPGDQSEDPA